jgi:hypothetical protein
VKGDGRKRLLHCFLRLSLKGDLGAAGIETTSYGAADGKIYPFFEYPAEYEHDSQKAEAGDGSVMEHDRIGVGW